MQNGRIANIGTKSKLYVPCVNKMIWQYSFDNICFEFVILYYKLSILRFFSPDLTVAFAYLVYHLTIAPKESAIFLPMI